MGQKRGTPAVEPGKDAVFAELMGLRGRGVADGEVAIRGRDPFFRTPFRVGETVAATIAATGVAANDIWEMRTGRRQRLGVDLRQAAARLRTVDYSQARDAGGAFRNIPIPQVMSEMLKVTQPWRTRDGRWVLPHFNLPNLKARVLGVLKCDYTPESVRAAVSQWNADDLEEAIAAVHACGGKIRTAEEWLEHPQGKVLAAKPVVTVTRIGDSAPEPFHPGDRPLSGLRVLDLTRVLAGPVAGRSLAEHGADVLMVTAPGLPQTPEHVRDTSHGKRSCFLDYTKPDEAERLWELAEGADVFVDGYRRGRLAAHGFGMEELMKRRPGLICVNVSCFGSEGPLAQRAGWEQVAQVMTGVCHANGMLTGAGQPKLVFAPLCDYTTGFLAAYGTMLALARRAREGGSYYVETTLCQAAMLVLRQGFVEDFSAAPERLTEAEIAASYVLEPGTAYGDLRTLGPALEMSETPCNWPHPTPKLGGDSPAWMPR
ncbi:CoA transferase [Oleispirillum naphthae]|uniref:CoA transferase n=1 Tax=Oleispirillum naphthae TaxID=2838853 RepID=UPI00308246D7